MSPLQQWSVRVLRRWPVIVALALALVGAAASAAWLVATARTTYTATAALSTQSSERGPEQDAVLALGPGDTSRPADRPPGWSAVPVNASPPASDLLK